MESQISEDSLHDSNPDQRESGTVKGQCWIAETEDF
jgi:hypothetical protein